MYKRPQSKCTLTGTLKIYVSGNAINVHRMTLTPLHPIRMPSMQYDVNHVIRNAIVLLSTCTAEAEERSLEFVFFRFVLFTGAGECSCVCLFVCLGGVAASLSPYRHLSSLPVTRLLPLLQIPLGLQSARIIRIVRVHVDTLLQTRRYGRRHKPVFSVLDRFLFLITASAGSSTYQDW